MRLRRRSHISITSYHVPLGLHALLLDGLRGRVGPAQPAQHRFSQYVKG